MTIELMQTIQSFIRTGRAYISTEYDIAKKDFGEEHFITKGRKKDLEEAEEAFKAISEEIISYWTETYKRENEELIKKVLENDV